MFNPFHKTNTMNKNYRKFLLLLFAPFILLVTACDDDDSAIPNEPPKIAFSVAEKDLQGIETKNGVGGPKITGTVQSDIGLKELTIELIKSSGNEVVQQLTSFDEVESRLYIIEFTPQYSPEVTGLRVAAVDQQNRAVEKTINITVKKEVPALTMNPKDGPVGTVVNVSVTAFKFTDANIQSVMLSDMEIADYTISEDGTSLTFTVPEGAQTGILTINVVGENPIVSAANFTVTEKPKVVVAYSDVVVNAQGVRNKEGKVTAFSTKGETFTLAQGLDAETSKKIDFIVADSGGDDNLDLFSPSHPTWLSGNYYKDSDGNAVVWPTMNQTKLLHLTDKDANFFANVTSEEIAAMSLGSDFKTRIEANDGPVGTIILFETADGEKGLLHVKAHDPNAADGSKADIFTFDIKVLE